MEDSEDIYSDVNSDEFVQDMQSYGVSQALPIDAEGIDDDAAAYLRAVREEASRIPHVTFAAMRRFDEPDEQHEPQDNSNIQPPPMIDWIQSVIDVFLEGRQQVHQARHGRPRRLDEAQVPYDQPVPGPNDRRGWQQRMHDASFQPYADTLSKMDNNLAASCLCALVDEVSNRCAPAPPPSQGAAAAPHLPGEALPAHLALWLYGLMVRLEQPVTPEVAAALRRIVTVAEAGLQHCRAQAKCHSQDSTVSSIECGGVTEDADTMHVDGACTTEAAQVPCSPQQLSQLNQTVDHDTASPAVCTGSCSARGGDGVGLKDGDSGEGEGDVACGAGCTSKAESCARQLSVDDLNRDGMGMSESLQDDGGVSDQNAAVTQEVARCDTLRVLAGGFFGQDSTLAPLVHNYMQSAHALSH